MAENQQENNYVSEGKVETKHTKIAADLKTTFWFEGMMALIDFTLTATKAYKGGDDGTNTFFGGSWVSKTFRILRNIAWLLVKYIARFLVIKYVIDFFFINNIVYVFSFFNLTPPVLSPTLSLWAIEHNLTSFAVCLLALVPLRNSFFVLFFRSFTLFIFSVPSFIGVLLTFFDNRLSHAVFNHPVKLSDSAFWVFDPFVSCLATSLISIGLLYFLNSKFSDKYTFTKNFKDTVSGDDEDDDLKEKSFATRTLGFNRYQELRIAREMSPGGKFKKYFPVYENAHIAAKRINETGRQLMILLGIILMLGAYKAYDYYSNKKVDIRTYDQMLLRKDIVRTCSSYASVNSFHFKDLETNYNAKTFLGYDSYQRNISHSNAINFILFQLADQYFLGDQYFMNRNGLMEGQYFFNLCEESLRLATHGFYLHNCEPGFPKKTAYDPQYITGNAILVEELVNDYSKELKEGCDISTRLSKDMQGIYPSLEEYNEKMKNDKVLLEQFMKENEKPRIK